MNDHAPCGGRITLAFATIAWLSWLVGCATRDPNWKETVPVTGTVTVDGEPVEGVTVTLTRASDAKAGGDSDAAASGVIPSMTFTSAAGVFAMSTYEQGDGAPVGEYVVTFAWPTLNLLTMQYGGDRLNNKYADLEVSKTRVVVESGKPVNLGKIALSTKEE